MISGHKKINVFKRYNIVHDEGLRSATLKLEAYLKAQEENATGTIHDFKEKRVSP